MGHLLFNVDANLKQIVRHTMESKEWRKNYGAPPIPKSLLLVHAEGVYLMSAGVPGNVKNEESGQHHVAYALGLDPSINEDYWADSRDVVGGDDFASPFSIEELAPVILGDQCSYVRINLTESHFDISLMGTPKTSKSRKKGRNGKKEKP